MLLARIKRLLREPPREIARRTTMFVLRCWRQARQQMRDRLFSTHPPDRGLPQSQLMRLVPAFDLEALTPWRDMLAADSEQILQHRFSFLGVRQVRISKDLQPDGLEGYRYASPAGTDVNRANRKHAAKLNDLISDGYQALDWQVDARSGYRWPVTTPSSGTTYGSLPGVDVKYPWELARMQHAPRLALASAQHWLSGDHEAADRLRLEYQNQVLDFLASNPPRFGVNWACTMDVAIRIANLLIARDIFVSVGMRFPPEFEMEFKRSVLAHGRHIVANLEWFAHLRSNHYLSNVAGLLFVAAYLPASPETDAWLAFAANELGKELFSQFQADGSNFEGSTSYHRLSAEMAVFSVALAHRIAHRLASLDFAIVQKEMNGLGRGVFPDEFAVTARYKLTSQETLSHLTKIMAFSREITRPDGGIVQIGDNDSGKFFDLTPIAETDAHAVDNHAILIECIQRLFDGRRQQAASLDSLLVSGFVGDAKDRLREISSRPPARDDKLSSFDAFGLYVYRRPRIWMSVRCGSVGQLGNGGHAHNDQLSLEVCFDGVAFLVDPGTYVYTSLPEQRNAFRSTQAHATLVADPGEQNIWLAGSVGLFSLTRVAATRVIRATVDDFVGEHDGFASTHRRTIAFHEGGFEVTDECQSANRMLVFPLASEVAVEQQQGGFLLSANGVNVTLEISGGVPIVGQGAFSSGYGRKIKTNVIRVREVPENCHWTMRIQEAVIG